MTLFFERRIGWHRQATQGGCGLSKQPWPSQRCAGDHHTVNFIAAQRMNHFLGAVQIAVANEWDVAQMLLDLGDALPIGLAFEKILSHSTVHGERCCAGLFHHTRYGTSVLGFVRTSEPNLRRNWRR